MLGKIFLIILFVGIIMCFVALAKNENTHKNRCIIANAVYSYNKEIIDNGGDPDFTLYNKIKSYDEVFWNFF